MAHAPWPIGAHAPWPIGGPWPINHPICHLPFAIADFHPMHMRASMTVAFSCLAVTLVAQAPAEKGRLGIALSEITKPWTGDLDGMAERRMIRVLTAYSRTQYFI